MTDANEYEPDEDVIGDRRPMFCPFCGHGGAFDGQGIRSEQIPIVSEGQLIEAEWYQVRCPHCDGVFRMRESATEVQE